MWAPCSRGAAPAATPVPDPPETPPAPGVLRFFTAHEARTVEALAARILPSGPDGFGAREAGVLNYVDYLLAQEDAFGQPIYRRPPYARAYEGEAPSAPPANESSGDGLVLWVKKEDLRRYGFQSALDPREIYRRGLSALDRCAQTASAADFADLPPDAQDELVGALAADAAAGFDEPGARAFFETVEEHTIEGAFSDPQYGGNRNKIGWQAIAILRRSALIPRTTSRTPSSISRRRPWPSCTTSTPACPTAAESTPRWRWRCR